MCKDADARKSTAVWGKGPVCTTIGEAEENGFGYTRAGWHKTAQTLSRESGLHTQAVADSEGFEVTTQ